MLPSSSYKNGNKFGKTALETNLELLGKYQHHTVVSHINQLQIGHTRLTHSYLLSGDDQPECVTCQCPLTVKHILIGCPDFTNVWNKYFTASSIEKVFKETDVKSVINFVKETHFYSLL